MTDRELMQQALDALLYHTEQTRPITRTAAAITALRERLAQPEQEPVAWIKCSERLPQNKRAVLVLSPSNRCIFCAYWDTDQWLYFGGYPQPISHPVTHWRTVPPPPTGDEK